MSREREPCRCILTWGRGPAILNTYSYRYHQVGMEKHSPSLVLLSVYFCWDRVKITGMEKHSSSLILLSVYFCWDRVKITGMEKHSPSLILLSVYFYLIELRLP